jgi:predicted amidophosphoribosyltransferase
MQCEYAHEGEEHTSDEDIGDFSARTIALEAAFADDRNLEGKDVLLLDDPFQSGARASMNVAAKTLKEQGLVKSDQCTR